MENTSRPWVWIAVGLCALISLAILFKRHTQPDAHQEAQEAERLARAVLAKSNAHSDWAAHDAGDDVSLNPRERVGEVRKPVGSARDRGDGTTDELRAGSEGDGWTRPEIAARGRHDASQRAVVRSASDGSAPDSGLTGSIRSSAAEQLARQSREARGRLAQGGRDLVAAEPVAPEPVFANAATEDPEKPVFSAFKDGKLESEEGVAPVAVENVESKDGSATFGKDSQYAVPQAGGLQGSGGAVSFWVKPDWQGTEQDDAHMVDLSTPNVWENRLSINKNGRYLRFMLFPNTGQEAGVSAVVDAWQPGEQHHVVATWGPEEEGGNVIEFFVDGKLVGRDVYDGEFEVPTTDPMVIGNNRSGQLGARGGISGFEVYNTRVSPDRVGTIFQSAPQ